jgi:hypothetical protein
MGEAAEERAAEVRPLAEAPRWEPAAVVAWLHCCATPATESRLRVVSIDTADGNFRRTAGRLQAHRWKLAFRCHFSVSREKSANLCAVHRILSRDFPADPDP